MHEAYYIHTKNDTFGPVEREEAELYREAGTLFSRSPNGPWRSYEEFFDEAIFEADSFKDGSKIKIVCPGCGQRYKGEYNYIDRKIKCVNCHIKFRVKAPCEPPHRNRGNLICPHCWKRFNEDELLSIARHPFLTGDPVLGELAEMRFKPEVFDSNGIPLDERGEPSPDRACPVCHLRFPEKLTDDPLFFLTISGAPSAGKSSYIKSLVKRAKRELNPLINYSFFEIDSLMDKEIMRNRASDFPHKIKINGFNMKLPRPCIYALKSSGKVPEKNCSVIFYDTDGKYHLPDTEDPSFPVSGHLCRSNGIIFLADVFTEKDKTFFSDENILSELIRRFRAANNVPAGGKCNVPLVIAISKFDCSGFPGILDPEKYPLIKDKMLYLNGVYALSEKMRSLLLEKTPEIIYTAEANFENIVYLPVINSDSFKEGYPLTDAEIPLLVLLAKSGFISCLP